MKDQKLSPIGPPGASPEKVRYLWRRPSTGAYYARVRVPPGLGLGDHLQESLRTKDQKEALRRLPLVAAKLLAERERRQRGEDGGLKRDLSTPKAWAEWWRSAVIARGADPDRGAVPDDLDLQLDAEVERRLGPEIGEEEEGDGTIRPRYDPEGEREAKELIGLARGLRLPIGGELERYLAERRLKPRYASRTNRAVKALGTWSRERAGGDDLRRIDRREAGLFVDQLIATGITAATANSLVSSLSSYWDWMERRGIAKSNPWTRQNRKPPEIEAERSVRPFTDEEAAALLCGDANRTLHDLMRVAALSGMRINEIANLRVGDVEGEVMQIRASKTAAGVRRVPVHPSLVTVINRRSASKPPEAFLFDELKAPASRPAERSAKASERFTAYRRSLGIDERGDGQRNSSVNFHSWRHWFITHALHAGQPTEIVAAVVGHQSERNAVTLRTYNSTGPALDQLRAVVLAVRLPEGVPEESPPGPLMNSGARRRRS